MKEKNIKPGVWIRHIVLDTEAIIVSLKGWDVAVKMRGELYYLPRSYICQYVRRVKNKKDGK